MTRTEAAIQALVAALTPDPDAGPDDVPALPAPLRNESLVARLVDLAPGVAVYVNVWDGDGEVVEEALGADLGETIDDEADAGSYEIEHRAVIELVVTAASDAEREAAFDAAMIAIHEAVRPAVDGSIRTYLGGAVDMCRIERVTRAGSGLVTDGMPNCKAAEITVLLEFTSPRPF